MDALLGGLNVEKLTLIAAMLIVITGAVKGWWVPGYLYIDVCKQRDAAQQDVRESIDTLKDQSNTLRRITEGWRPPR